MTFYIQIANQRIQIQSLYEKVYTWCKDYLVSPGEDAWRSEDQIKIRITPEDIKKEDHAMQYSAWKKHPESIMLYHPAHLEIFALYRRICEIMPLYGTFLMHGSVIATEGLGYMITAPSGVGKTTRSRIWQKEYPDSVIVNGDKPLFSITPARVYAHGTPWAGKEGENSNECVPLQAVFLLERTNKGEPDTIQKLHSLEAFAFLLQQSYHPEDSEAMHQTVLLLKSFVQTVDLYRLRCAPTAEAVRLAYETARPEKKSSDPHTLGIVTPQKVIVNDII